jgi:hypothetical protein
MADYWYMRTPLQMLHQGIVDQYNLTPLIHNNCVCVEIRNGIHVLPQVGKLASNQLIEVFACLGIIRNLSSLVSSDTILVTSSSALSWTTLMLNAPTRMMLTLYL